MTIQQTIQSQYHAALEMLRQAINHCPDQLWDEAENKNRFWHVAYHALFYTHLYLQPAESDFIPWERSEKDDHYLGPTPRMPDIKPEIERPYSRAELLEYLDLVRQQVDSTVDRLDFAGPSGFSWLPFNKLEVQFYNLRHLQHHAGELCERLWAEAEIEIGWVGRRP